ncbi:30S ribosomal protein S9 [bacterium]|nr:MAG: 30S ribosomal protein S9 [bacterium]
MATKAKTIKNKTKVSNETELENQKYIFALGRRKTAIASVRLYEGQGISTINDRNIEDFLDPQKLDELLRVFSVLDLQGQMFFTAKANGGGTSGLVGAVRLGIARALSMYNPDYKKTLKDSKYLTRDPRKVERKKSGLKKARKAPQYSKR